MKTEFENIIKEIDKRVEQPFVTSRFGDTWRESAVENHPAPVIARIAWFQGRKSILLENELKLAFEQIDKLKNEIYQLENDIKNSKNG